MISGTILNHLCNNDYVKNNENYYAHRRCYFNFATKSGLTLEKTYAGDQLKAMSVLTSLSFPHGTKTEEKKSIENLSHIADNNRHRDIKHLGKELKKLGFNQSGIKLKHLKSYRCVTHCEEQNSELTVYHNMLVVMIGTDLFEDY